MNNTLVIRDAKPDEAGYLSALALRSKAHCGYSDDFMRACEAELTYDPGQIASIGPDFVVAEMNSVIAGFYALECISTARFELDALFVEPARIGEGVGSRLIRHAVENVAMQGGKTLVIQGDPNAVGFYIASGARLVGSRESGSISSRNLPLFEIAVNQSTGSSEP